MTEPVILRQGGYHLEKEPVFDDVVMPLWRAYAEAHGPQTTFKEFCQWIELQLLIRCNEPPDPTLDEEDWEGKRN